MSQMPTEWELLTRAVRLRREHGERSLRVIGERIGELLMAGDPEGVKMWRAVEDRLQNLNRRGSLYEIR